MKRFERLLVIATVFLTAAVFSVSAAGSNETEGAESGADSTGVVKIGVLAPLSGGAAADGEEMVNGTELAVQEVNAAGGINGYTFEVVVGDVEDQSSDAVVAATQRLLGDDDIHFVLTGYATQSNFEIDYFAEAGMIYMVAGNSNQTRDMVTDDPGRYETIWSYTPSFDAYETDLLPVVEQLSEQGALELPNDKLAIVSSDNAYSKSIYEGIKESFLAADWEVTLDEVIPSGEINDWRSLLARVRRDTPGVLVNTDWVPANAATFMTQFMEDPTDSLVFIQYGPSVPEFVELTQDVSTGVVYNLLGGPLLTSENPRALEVNRKYEEAYGTEPGIYGSALYEMTNVYFDALRKTGDPTDHEAVSEAIGATDKQVSTGRLVFDPETHLAKGGVDFVPIQFYQIWNGERVLFYPEQYATGEFREPPWMK